MDYFHEYVVNIHFNVLVYILVFLLQHNTLAKYRGTLVKYSIKLIELESSLNNNVFNDEIRITCENMRTNCEMEQ